MSRVRQDDDQIFCRFIWNEEEREWYLWEALSVAQLECGSEFSGTDACTVTYDIYVRIGDTVDHLLPPDPPKRPDPLAGVMTEGDWIMSLEQKKNA